MNITFTREKLKRLIRCYNKCTTETFMFEDNEYLKEYAKYLIQHLKTVFKGVK